jgi:hypothetical protein
VDAHVRTMLSHRRDAAAAEALAEHSRSRAATRVRAKLALELRPPGRSFGIGVPAQVVPVIVPQDQQRSGCERRYAGDEGRFGERGWQRHEDLNGDGQWQRKRDQEPADPPPQPR